MLQVRLCDLLAGRLTESLEMKCNPEITGLVRHKGHLVVTHRGDSSLYVYQAAHPTACEHQVGLSDPRHMVEVKDGDKDHLVISDFYGRLHWVPMLVVGEELKLGAVRTIQLDYMPCGMCVTSIGQVVVACGTDRLYKYSSDGQYLGHIQLASGVEPVSITSLSAGDGYVICDLSQITWIREDGTALHRVQPGEVKPGMRLGEPHDLIHDNDGHILVADGNHVFVFDQHGHCTGQLLSDQGRIRQPRHLLLDQLTDTLHVACDHPTRVMIYPYSSLMTESRTRSAKNKKYTLSKLDEAPSSTSELIKLDEAPSSTSKLSKLEKAP